MGFGKGFRFGDAPTERPSIEKFKISEDEVKFITILDTDALEVSATHYLPGVGYFHCHRTEDSDGVVEKGFCCKIMEDLYEKGLINNSFPSQRATLPIIVFGTKTVDGRKKIDHTNTSFARLELTNSDYKELIGSITDEEDIEIEDITKYVIRVRGEETGKGQYKRIAPKFKPQTVKSPVLSDAKLKEEVKDFLAKYHELIHSILGKDFDEAKLSKISDSIISNSKAPNEEYEEPSVDDESQGTSKDVTDTVEASIPNIQLEPDLGEETDLSFLDDESFLND